MRFVLFFLLSIAAASALAQQQRPPNLEPLPEAPPPPLIRDGADEPSVRIAPQEGDRVEETRDSAGRVVMMKVTPPGGVPYNLLDTFGDGNWTRRDALDPGNRVPMWTIKTFD
jgi:hypothetical protein